jgi:hypothetical protein
MVTEDQRPHPGRPRAFIVLEDAADNNAIRQNVVIVIAPLT